MRSVANGGEIWRGGGSQEMGKKEVQWGVARRES